MEEAWLQTLMRVKAFLDGTAEAALQMPKAKWNQFINRVIKRFGYIPNMNENAETRLRL